MQIYNLYEDFCPEFCVKNSQKYYFKKGVERIKKI